MQLSTWLDQKFRVTASGSTLKKEIIGGLILFAVTIYALPTNAGMFSGVGLTSFGAMYFAAGIGSIFGTLLLAFKANVPIAQLPGMGLNAYIIYTLCLTMGLSYPNAILLVNLEGLLFIVISKTGLRKKMFHALPKGVLTAIGMALGAFLFVIGLSGAGIITTDPAMSTGWSQVSWNILDGNASWATIMPRLIFLATLIATFVLAEGRKDKAGNWVKKPVQIATIICMIGGTLLYYILGATVPGFYTELSENLTLVSPAAAFTAWLEECAFIGLREGWKFGPYLASHGMISLAILIITQVPSLTLCDSYDTNGTALGCAEIGGQMKVDEKGEPYWDKMDIVMAADAGGTEGGACAGCSPVTSYAESSAAFAFGAKTGLAALVAAICYLFALLLSPVASLIPSAVYSVPLAYVGISLIRGNRARTLDWIDDLPTAVGGVVTVLMMPITYNISYGIAWGLFFYCLTMLLLKRGKEVPKITYFITALFVVMFFVTH